MRIAKILMILILSFVAFDYADAQNLNIDFGAADGAPSNVFGAASGQAGIWNTMGLGTTSGLLDITGATTTAAVTVTAQVDTGSSGGACSGDLGALLNDNFYTTGATWSVDFSGLTNGTYSVYLYGPNHTSVETGNMVAGGVPVASISGDGCSFIDGTTHTIVQVSVTNGTLSIAGTNIASFAGLSGIQLIEQAVAVVPGMGNSFVFPPFPAVCGVPGASFPCVPQEG